MTSAKNSTNSPAGPRLELPRSFIDPPGPFSPRKELEDFLAQAREWQKADPSDLSVTWAIETVEGDLRAQEEAAARLAKRAKK